MGALGAVIVIGGAVIAAIVIGSASGAAGAAAASALLVKYGLEYHRRSQQLEDDIEKMCCEEIIRVKDVPDMSFQECVDYAIAACCNPTDDVYSESLAQLPEETAPVNEIMFVHRWSSVLSPKSLLLLPLTDFILVRMF